MGSQTPNNTSYMRKLIRNRQRMLQRQLKMLQMKQQERQRPRRTQLRTIWVKQRQLQQDSDFATTQQEQKQVDLDNAEKEVKGATANLLKQEDNKKAIEEMHKLAREKAAEEEEQLQMDEQDAGQRAVAVAAGPVEDTNESSQSLVDTAASTEDAASTEVHELGNDDKLED